MDLVKLINENVVNLHESGKLDEIIEKHVLECVDDIVKDSFMWNGEAKKAIEEALKDKLKINTKDMRLDRYQKMVHNIVQERINETIIKDLHENVKEAIDSATEYLEKREWKLSEIIEKFVDLLDKSYDGEMESEYGECTLHVDVDREFCHIYFDKNSDEDKYGCDNKMFIYKNKLSSAEVGKKPFSPHSIHFMDNFTDFLFKLYCNNVTIEIDEDKCVLEYTREDANY